MNLIGLLVALLIICLVIWSARALMTAFKIEDPIRTVIYVAIVILVMIWLIGVIGYGPNFHIGRM